MYDAITDSYCYQGTNVLKNLLGLQNQSALDAFEIAMTTQRADELIPSGNFGSAHYYAIHRHLFQDIYQWAGEIRTVRIGKGGNAFCYPEHIAKEMEALFNDLESKNYFKKLPTDKFAVGMAHFLATLNAIHPFREGNGRTQLSLFFLLAGQAEHPVDFTKLISERFMEAMIASFGGDEAPLVAQILELI